MRIDRFNVEPYGTRQYVTLESGHGCLQVSGGIEPY
jgi:hypothetical protein